MVVNVPFWVAVIIVILAVVIWISEQAKKARMRRERREAGRRLAADLNSPRPSPRLPYGLSDSEDPDTVRPPDEGRT